jgi:hypothetical protein
LRGLRLSAAGETYSMFRMSPRLRNRTVRAMHVGEHGTEVKNESPRRMARLSFWSRSPGYPLIKTESSLARSISIGSRRIATLICLSIPQPLSSTDNPVVHSKNRLAKRGKKLVMSLLGVSGENLAQNANAKSTICCLRTFRGRPVLRICALRAATRTSVSVGITPALSNSLA